MIVDQRTGNYQELAGKLNVAPSTVYRLLAVIRSYEVEIYYDKDVKSYCYEANKEVKFDGGFYVVDTKS